MRRDRRSRFMQLVSSPRCDLQYVETLLQISPTFPTDYNPGGRKRVIEVEDKGKMSH